MQQQAGLHEQALNKAAELGIASQLDEVEQLRVAVQADPFKLVTGEVDGVAIVGEGLVMNQDLRVERLENLLAVVESDGDSADLLPMAGAGLKLLLGPDGNSLRQRLLLTLVHDDRFTTADLQQLMQLMRRTFSPRKIAGGMLARLNPLAA